MNRNTKILYNKDFKKFLNNEIAFFYSEIAFFYSDDFEIIYTIHDNSNMQTNISHINKRHINVNLSYKKLYEYIDKYNIKNRKNKLKCLI